jgi:hypothetical protein
MSQLVKDFFRDEQHASIVLVDIAVGAIIIGFIVAVGAILFLK